MSNSKKVFLKRNRPFVHDNIKTPEAQEYLGLTKRSVGSYFYSKHSTRMGSGLNDEETLLLLPQIVGVSAQDIDFRKKVDKFYTEIDTFVDYEKGRELEIGLEIDNERSVTYKESKEVPDGRDSTGSIKKKFVDVYNMPISVEDYVRFRHAVGNPEHNLTGHPKVAASPDEAKGNQTVDFYIEDPTKVLESRATAIDYADEALATYQIVKTDKDKIKMVLSLLQPHLHKLLVKKPGEVVIVENMKDEEMLFALRELAMKKASLFQATATDSELTNKYYLNELVSMGLLRRIGTSIIVNESSEPLGATDSDAVYTLFKDPARAALLGSLKAMYKERKNLAKLAK